MFAFGGDAFPTDSQSVRAALGDAARAHGAGGDAVVLTGDFPSFETLRVNLTGVHFDARTVPAGIVENGGGGFFTRVLEVTAAPARVASIPVELRMHAEDGVFTFGTAADGRRAARLDRCARATLEVEATTADLEAALLLLARDAAAKHGAEVQSVRLTLDAESPHALAVTAVAVAKAMFFTATLTIRGRLALDENFDLRLTGATCAGDGMIANLAAAQLRPRLADLEGRAFSIRALLPAGLQPDVIALSGGGSLQIHATFGAK